MANGQNHKLLKKLKKHVSYANEAEDTPVVKYDDQRRKFEILNILMKTYTENDYLDESS